MGRCCGKPRCYCAQAQASIYAEACKLVRQANEIDNLGGDGAEVRAQANRLLAMCEPTFPREEQAGITFTDWRRDPRMVEA